MSGYFFCNIFLNSSLVITPSPSGSSSAIISCNEKERNRTKLVSSTTYLDLRLCARVAKTDHHFHQLISRNDAESEKFWFNMRRTQGLPIIVSIEHFECFLYIIFYLLIGTFFFHQSNKFLLVDNN